MLRRGNGIVIRKASKVDLPQVLKLVCAYHEYEDIKLSDRQRETSVRSLMNDRSLGGIWLVYSDELPVGYIALCFGYSIEFSGREATVDEFYIMPEYRGKGLGTKVLEFITTEARKHDIKVLHLEVARSNKKARKLYSQAGFTTREKYVMMSLPL